MTEDEVNISVKKWLLSQKYKYKGILNPGSDRAKSTDIGFGQVQIPLPNGKRLILIDHQGVRDVPPDLIWVEAKGGEVGMSQLLEGFIRVTCACYWGGGSGLLAIPPAECKIILEQQEFLRLVGVSCERRVGILDAEKQEAYWLT
jgi:hypothetical protein